MAAIPASSMRSLRLLRLLLVIGGLGCSLSSGGEERAEDIKDWQVAPRRAGMVEGMVVPPPVLPGWSSTGALATPRSDHTATLLPSGKVLIAGGWRSSGHLTSAELYDPATGVWSHTGALTMPRSFHKATLLPSGKVLVTGGYGASWDPLASAEVYDPATGKWSFTGALAMARVSHTATLLPSGKVLVTGGVDRSNVYYTSAEVYDPATEAWSPTGSLTAARAGHSATLLLSGKVLVTGGLHDSSEVYDPATETWSPTGSRGGDRFVYEAVLLLSGKVLVTQPAKLYDPDTGAWSATGALASTRTSHTATLLPSGKVLVTGGANSSAEVYDPATGAWSRTADLAVARYGRTATLLPSGNVLVAGGSDGSGYFFSARAEVYAALMVVTPALDSITSDTTPTYSGIAEPNATVTLIVNGSPVGNTLADAAGHWSLTPTTALTDGLHAVRAAVKDAVGTPSAESNAHTFTVDITPPAAPGVVAPADGSTTGDNTPTYSGTAEPGTTVTLIVDDTPVGNTTADATGNWSYIPTTALPDGQRMVRATAADALGNVSAPSSANAFMVDTTPPAAPVVQLPADGVTIGDNTPTYSGSAEAGSTVTLFVNGAPMGTTMADAEGSWSFTSTTALADRQRRVWARAMDVAGNLSLISAINLFTIDTVPPGAPGLSVPDTFNTQKPIIAGTAEPYDTITIWLDGTEAGSTAATSTGLWVFSPDTEMAEGPHLVKATARDTAGNVSPDSAELSFMIVIVKKSHYGWDCATAPTFPASWAVLALSLALRGRWPRSR